MSSGCDPRSFTPLSLPVGKSSRELRNVAPFAILRHSSLLTVICMDDDFRSHSQSLAVETDSGLLQCLSLLLYEAHMMRHMPDNSCQQRSQVQGTII